MVTAAMAWCDGYTAPLLVPLNGWLQPPLPLQIRTLSYPQGVKLVEATTSGQHVIIVPFQGDAQLWHVMSGQLVHTFKGIFLLLPLFQFLILNGSSLNHPKNNFRTFESNFVLSCDGTLAIFAHRL